MESIPHIVIIGAGFAGLEAAKRLAKLGSSARVTVIDRRNHHLFQPLLYQVATAALSGPDIASPIRSELSRAANTTVLLGEVDVIDLAAKTLRTAHCEHAWDYLLLATGVSNNYYGHDEWEQDAPGLKSIAEALEIRRRVLLAFETAEAENDPDVVERLLTFVVVGAGPTGVELAGALSEIARHTMARQFRTFDPAAARVVLIEAGPRILPTFDERLSKRAQEQLEALGVQVRTGRLVRSIDSSGVVLGDDRIDAGTVLWAAGVSAGRLERKLGVEADRIGRLIVRDDLSLPAHADVFVAGDIAHVELQGELVPGVAQAAIQMGRHGADNIVRRIRGEATLPFAYKDKGNLATIGRSAGVAEIRRFRFSGAPAWWLWLTVHIYFLIGFRNRVVVMFSWMLAYLFWTRRARVILDEPPGRPGLTAGTPSKVSDAGGEPPS